MKRIFLTLLILFGFVAAQNSRQDLQQMMRIYGRVSGETLTEGNVDEDCEQTCFNRDDCILAYFNEQDHCILLDFNSTQTVEVVETTRAERLFVSFKSLSLDCPDYKFITLLSLSLDCPDYKFITLLVNMGPDPIQWTKTGSTWNFKKCVGDWKMFKRSYADREITVCMRPFRFINITRSEGFAYCKSIGYNVTGVATAIEAKWLFGTYTNKLKMDTGLFIDGERDCHPPGTNCTNFKWTDGYTEGIDFWDAAGLSWRPSAEAKTEDCLASGWYSTWGVIISNILCDDTSAQQGVVCGYQLE